MTEVLYSIIIRPLLLIYQLVFGTAYKVTGNYGISIIFLSLAFNLLVFPLYKRADAIQNQERDLQARMAPWVAHIKKTFHGDERVMMLSTYYRQNNYSAVYALRGSISLLLQIPFFIAAYRFLSGYPALQGVSFGPIADLGRPDGILRLAGHSINLLPVIMTAVNIVSGVIYTKGLPVKTRLQTYGIALFFLVFLYRSPAGLVFYWTLNNVFSLGKNIVGKLLKKESQDAAAGAEAAENPLSAEAADERLAADAVKKTKADGDLPLFIISGLGLAVLTGLLVTSAVVGASPQEYVSTYRPSDPGLLLVRPCLIAAGFFLLWAGVFYGMAGKALRSKMALGMFLLLTAGTVNYMFFGRNLGMISPDLIFSQAPSYSAREIGLNLLALAAAIGVVCLIARFKKEALRAAGAAVLVGFVVLSAMNLRQIRTSYREMLRVLSSDAENSMPEITLSKTGKNVMVIMLDRAVNGYFPYIMKEKPELADQFAGFTYYPNTISYGAYTNFGTPGLFGGYEYTVEAMNERDADSLAVKHNEALKMMPRLFSDNGYKVTVCDPPYAGYSWTADLSIYDDLPGVEAYRLKGRMTPGQEESEAIIAEKRKRNLFCYGIFKTAPVCLQTWLYDDGSYFAPPEALADTGDATGEEAALSEEEAADRKNFLDCYYVLENLHSITSVTDDDTDTLLVFQNATTHEEVPLQKPDYTPATVVDNADYDAAHADAWEIDGQVLHMDSVYAQNHYDVNMAAIIQVGKWFDELRRLGVYDNTRIIIAADHGKGLGQIDALKFDEIGLDAMWLNPLMLVKDFGETGALQTSDAFMTNADVPSLAVRDLIDDPVNPYTGVPIEDSAKQGEQHVVYSNNWDIYKNRGKRYDTSDGQWYAVHDNIFDADNWKKIDEP